VRKRWPDAGALAFLALVPTLLFGDILFGRASFYIRDLAHYSYPARKVLREIILSGHFPYWNPFLSAGQPMAANPVYAVFYPPSWLILLPDYHRAFQVLILLHVYIALFGMYALLRSMRLGRPAAVFGALSFGIGGLMISLTNVLPILFATAWLPLTALFTRRFLLDRRARDFALAALFLALQLLGGEPVTALQVGIILGMYAVYRGVRDRAVARYVAAIGAICVAAVLLAAVQILPAIDHLRDSSRGPGMTWTAVSQWSTPPLRVAELLHPTLLGRIDSNGVPFYWGSELYPGTFSPLYFSIYAGLAVAVLAMSGVFARLRGWVLFVAMAAVSFLLAIGDHTPLLRFLYDHGLGLVRFPEKLLIIGVFACVVFSAHALQQLLDREPRTRKAALALAIAVTAIAFCAAVATATAPYQTAFQRIFHPIAEQPMGTLMAIARADWLLTALRGLLLAILIRNVTHSRRNAWLALSAAFLLFDLAYQLPTLAPRVDRSFFTTPPPAARQFPARRDDFRIFHMADWGKASKRGLQYRAIGDARYWMARNGLLTYMPHTYGLRTVIDGDFDMTDLKPEQDFTAAVWELAGKGGPPDWIDIAISMSNAWYVGIYRNPKEAMPHGWNRGVEPVKFVEGRHYPRYYLATQLVRIRDHADFVRQLRTHRFGRQVAFIREPVFTAAGGNVRVLREWPNGARLDVQAMGRAFLVMSVTPHKYWRVTIDGAPAPALVTNLGYQGVVVPAGRHIVEMRYRNPLIAIGGGITVMTLLALLVVARGREGSRLTALARSTASTPLPTTASSWWGEGGPERSEGPGEGRSRDD
jgi:hypothetical protein